MSPKIKSDPFGQLNIDIKSESEPQIMYSSYPAEFHLMDKALRIGGLRITMPSKKAAFSIRFKIHKARILHRRANRDTEEEMKYDRIMVTLDGLILGLEILPDLFTIEEIS